MSLHDIWDKNKSIHLQEGFEDLVIYWYVFKNDWDARLIYLFGCLWEIFSIILTIPRLNKWNCSRFQTYLSKFVKWDWASDASSWLEMWWLLTRLFLWAGWHYWCQRTPGIYVSYQGKKFYNMPTIWSIMLGHRLVTIEDGVTTLTSPEMFPTSLTMKRFSLDIDAQHRFLESFFENCLSYLL